jgi:GT2 family glycosyltransferase/SAM-dependent methyltransferase
MSARDTNIAVLDQELTELRGTLSARDGKIAVLESAILTLRASTSWRITAPLRFVKRLLGRFRYNAVGYPLTLFWRVLKTRSRVPLRDWHATRVIARSGLFDRDWYIMTNPDVAACGIDPVRHYVAFGAREGRDPSPSFNTTDYLSQNPDIAATGANPLSHFILHAAFEGRVAYSCNGAGNPPSRQSGSNLREAFIAWHRNAAIDFPAVATPEVSVIVPAHRGLADLETCLRSLSVHRATEPSFEVIVLDDCPDESVLWAIPCSGGLTKIANETNVGFLLTCNRGAAAARGRIFCFLNSDTIVSAGWLRSLVEALDEMPRAAVAGGMLLNVDGTIQDAGWRILRDGWGRPIGRGSDSQNGSYTYRRSVDCVGGACFAVRREVWNELDGFDTIYAPAYYEEFDFAFRARMRGFQVIYEPRSRVLHLGSTSYGAERRDQLSSINHAKFCARFADILRRHPPDAVDDFTLRHASGEGPVLLVIDDEVPQPDQHAGDVVMSRYLAMLATAGWRVVFGPMSGRAEGRAAEALESQGIQLIRAPVTIEEWLAKYGKYVREVWLARPDSGGKLLAPLRAYTDAHITYYTHDLHHLRLQRQAELYADPKLKVEAAEIKVRESEIFRGVDRVTTPSAVEAEIIRQLSPETPITVLPLYYCDATEICMHDAGHFAALSDVVFVGGFPHPPNVDAALFTAKEVMPLVWRERPDVRLLLVGYAPPAEVQALAAPRIRVTGHVPKLEPFFDASRVFLAAMRYGAGVKGKIVEAMRSGIPVVTTTIGAEGMGIESGFHAIVADDASGLARGVLELLHDANRCMALSKAGAELVRNQFSHAAARYALNEVFRTLRCGVCGGDRLIEAPSQGDFCDAVVCCSCCASGRTEAVARTVLRRFAVAGESCLAELTRQRSDLCIYEVGSIGGFAETLRGQPGYTISDYFEGVPRGAAGPGGVRCEDLTNLTFPADSFDVIISRDVIEHAPSPSCAFAEVARVLKPGGSHFFTVSRYRGQSQSAMQAKPEGALFCADYGMDLGRMHETAGLHLIDHEVPVLGGKACRSLRIFEAVKIPSGLMVQSGRDEPARSAV